MNHLKYLSSKSQIDQGRLLKNFIFIFIKNKALFETRLSWCRLAENATQIKELWTTLKVRGLPNKVLFFKFSTIRVLNMMKKVF